MSEKKYVTINEGIDFRTISKILTANGFRMNHATARNQLIIAMEKLLTHIAAQANGDKKHRSFDPALIDVDQMLKDPNIHEYLSDVLYAAHKLEMREEK